MYLSGIGTESQSRSKDFIGLGSHNDTNNPIAMRENSKKKKFITYFKPLSGSQRPNLYILSNLDSRVQIKTKNPKKRRRRENVQNYKFQSQKGSK